MKKTVLLLTVLFLSTTLFAQDITNKLGTDGKFEVNKSDGTNYFQIDKDGNPYFPAIAPSVASVLAITTAGQVAASTISINDLTDGKTGLGSVFLGANAGLIKTGTNNVGIGEKALEFLNDDSYANNIAIGYKAGSGSSNGLTAGSNNILIGSEVDATNISANNELNIGNAIYGTGIYNSSAKIGIGNGNNAPASTLDVKGDVTIETVLHLKPSSTPTSPSAGDIYFDSGTNKLRFYDGSAWQTVTTTSP